MNYIVLGGGLGRRDTGRFPNGHLIVEIQNDVVNELRLIIFMLKYWLNLGIHYIFWQKLINNKE